MPRYTDGARGMKLLYGANLRCETCGRRIEDAFATLNQDAEDHWCDACVDFRGGYVKKGEGGSNL